MAARENVTYGADVIKIYSNNTPNPASFSLEEMQTIVDEARRLGVLKPGALADIVAVEGDPTANLEPLECNRTVLDVIIASILLFTPPTPRATPPPDAPPAARCRV